MRQEVQAVLTHAEKTEDQRSGDVSHMSAQTVFSVLDYLTRWKRHRVEMLSASRTQKKSQSGSESNVEKTIRFLSHFLAIVEI